MADNKKQEKINNLISYIEKIRDYFSKYKAKTVDWAEKFGANEELAEAGANFWRHYPEPEYENIPDEILDSIGRSAFELLGELEQSKGIFLNNEIDNVVSFTTTSSVVIYGASASAMVHSCPAILPYQNRLNEIMGGLNQQKEVSQMLGNISPSLRDEYDNAWKNLRTSTKDITRSPMFLMREVFRRIIKLLSPDGEVRKFNKLQPSEDIKRSHRVNYIADKLESWGKNTFVNEIDLLKKVYKLLSKAHKEGELDIEQTRGYLYQVSALIKFLLDRLG